MTTTKAPEVLKEQEGWSNYPTWCVNLWLTNDNQGLLDQAKEVLANSLDRYNAEDNLRDMISELAYAKVRGNNGLTNDLMAFTLSYVNWLEIIDSFIDTYEPELSHLRRDRPEDR